MSQQVEYPRLLTYVWEGQYLALTFKKPDGETQAMKFGNWYSSTPLQLQGTIWPHRHSEDFTLPDQEIAFMVDSPQGMLAFIFLCDDSRAVFEYVGQDRAPNPQLLSIAYDNDTFTVRYSVGGAEPQEITISIFPSHHRYRLLEVSSDAHVRRRNHDPLLCLTVQTFEGFSRGLSFQVDAAEIKEVYAKLSAFVRAFDYPKAEAGVIPHAYLQAA